MVDAADDQIFWDGADNEWFAVEEEKYNRGRIMYYSKNSEVCNSWVLVPGTAILPKGFLATAYCLTLIYLFMGISIVSDIFMEAIEKITSKKVPVKVKDEKGNITMVLMDFWNPTVANLTLMALGSSAPEILLSCIETIGGLNKCPGELGASTIVGSAAFNLLVISGVSVYAVSEEEHDDLNADKTVPRGVKKINDLGVFAVTCISSIWAYLWLFICVRDNAIDLQEAYLTFAMFAILIVLAYGADVLKCCDRKKKSHEEPLMEE